MLCHKVNIYIKDNVITVYIAAISTLFVPERASNFVLTKLWWKQISFISFFWKPESFGLQLRITILFDKKQKKLLSARYWYAIKWTRPIHACLLSPRVIHGFLAVKKQNMIYHCLVHATPPESRILTFCRKVCLWPPTLLSTSTGKWILHTQRERSSPSSRQMLFRQI